MNATLPAPDCSVFDEGSSSPGLSEAVQKITWRDYCANGIVLERVCETIPGFCEPSSNPLMKNMWRESYNISGSDLLLQSCLQFGYAGSCDGVSPPSATNVPLLVGVSGAAIGAIIICVLVAINLRIFRLSRYLRNSRDRAALEIKLLEHRIDRGLHRSRSEAGSVEPMLHGAAPCTSPPASCPPGPPSMSATSCSADADASSGLGDAAAGGGGAAGGSIAGETVAPSLPSLPSGGEPVEIETPSAARRSGKRRLSWPLSRDVADKVAEGDELAPSVSAMVDAAADENRMRLAPWPAALRADAADDVVAANASTAGVHAIASTVGADAITTNDDVSHLSAMRISSPGPIAASGESSAETSPPDAPAAASLLGARASAAPPPSWRPSCSRGLIQREEEIMASILMPPPPPRKPPRLEL